MEKNIYIYIVVLALSLIGLSACATKKSSSTNVPVESNSLTSISSETSTISKAATTKVVESISWQENKTKIWDELQHTSLPKLRSTLAQTTDANNIAWLKLAIIGKKYSANTKELVNQLTTWRKEYPNHPANSLFPEDTKLSKLLNPQPSKHIALLLPLEGQLGTQGQAVRDGFLSAYYDSFAKSNQQQTLTFIDTSRNPNISALYQKALSGGADMIIGPLTKENVGQLSSLNSYPVPTLALNYTDKKLNSLPANFYQFGLSQKDEAEQVAIKASQAGRSNAIIIAPANQRNQHIAKSLIEQWQSQGGKVIDTYYYSSRANFSQDIATLMHVNPKEDREQMEDDNDKKILEQQRRQDFDVIFLLAQPTQGRIIVPLLKYYYANNIPIYSTSVIYSGSPSPQKDADLDGVIFCDIPWVLSNKSTKPQLSRLYAVGRDAQLLTNELQRLAQLPNFPIYAATGALTLNSKQQIYRRVPWTQMHAGNPEQ